MPPTTIAHDLFTAYVQHAVQLKVGDQQLDLTMDLTFFEEWSAKERLSMDSDGNGQISRSERNAYVKNLVPHISRQVKLRLAGRELSLAPLYDPEVDLLGGDRVGPGHHRLRLSFFALTAVNIHVGDELVVEDSLWPKAKALSTLQVECGDGAAFETKQVNDLNVLSEQPSETRRFTFRCLKPPTAITNAPQNIK